jgi:hypothetical protein
LSGDVVGVAQSFNGSANIVIPSTISNDAVTSAKIINGAVTVGKLGATEQTRIAKAWVNFNGTTSPGTILSSFNVSSVTKNGTGDYTVNFASALADANYASLITVNAADRNITRTITQTSSTIRFTVGDVTGVPVDPTQSSLSIFGN